MSPPNSSDRQPGPTGRPSARFALAGLLAAAGGLHLAALPGHLQASTAVGAFFALTAAAQLVGAVLVATRGSSRTMISVVAGNLGLLGLWALSRTTGLPTGGELGLREPLGVLDGLATAAEIIVVAGALAFMRRQTAVTGRRSAAWLPTGALAITWLASGGAGLALADAGHRHAGGHAHTVPIATPTVEAPAIATPSVGAPASGGLDHEHLDPGRHSH